MPERVITIPPLSYCGKTEPLSSKAPTRPFQGGEMWPAPYLRQIAEGIIPGVSEQQVMLARERLQSIEQHADNILGIGERLRERGVYLPRGMEVDVFPVACQDSPIVVAAHEFCQPPYLQYLEPGSEEPPIVKMEMPLGTSPLQAAQTEVLSSNGLSAVHLFAPDFFIARTDHLIPAAIPCKGPFVVTPEILDHIRVGIPAYKPSDFTDFTLLPLYPSREDGIFHRNALLLDLLFLENMVAHVKSQLFTSLHMKIPSGSIFSIVKDHLDSGAENILTFRVGLEWQANGTRPIKQTYYKFYIGSPASWERLISHLQGNNRDNYNIRPVSMTTGELVEQDLIPQEP